MGLGYLAHSSTVPLISCTVIVLHHAAYIATHNYITTLGSNIVMVM